MAFDKTQPTDTTKIRNLGVVIRPNWVAIESADSTFQPYALNLTDRDAAALASDPTAISTAFITYCKQDASGDPEFYGIDPDSNVLQFSDAGFVGGPSQGLKCSKIRFGTSSVDYDRNNLIWAYGQFTNSGATVVAKNCSFSKVATGRYRVVFTTPLSGTSYVAVATPFNEGNARLAKIDDKTNAQFDIFMRNEDNDARDTGGFFMVCGGF